MIILNNEKFNATELSILSFILLNSFTSTIIINLFKNYTTMEIIISLIISFLFGFPIITFLLKLYKNDYINNISKNKINKYFIKTLFTICALIIGIFSLYYNSTIIKTTLLPNHNYSIIILLLFTSSFLSKKGLKSITIASNLLFIIYFIISILSFFLNTPNINTLNLLPFNTNINKINFYEIIIYTIAPLFMLLIIPKNNIINFNEYKMKSKKAYIIFYIYLSIKILFILSILGINYYKILRYPEITMLKSISLFNFFERLEEILILNIFIENYILLALLMYYVINLFNNKYLIYIIPIILFLIVIKITSIDNYILLISNTTFIFFNFITHKRENT